MSALITTVRSYSFIILASVLTLACAAILLSVIARKMQYAATGQNEITNPVLFRTGTSQNPKQRKVINHTQALQVLPLETTPSGELLLKVKNVSLKDVNSFVVASDGGDMTLDTSSGDRVIAPGAIEETMMPVPRDIDSLQILAVAFTDGIIEGEPESVAELRQMRADLKMQLSRGLSAVNAILNSPEADRPAALDTLEKQLSSLETRSNPNSEGQVIGLNNGKDDLINDIQSVRTRLQAHGELNQRKLLTLMKERLERRIAAL